MDFFITSVATRIIPPSNTSAIEKTSILSGFRFCSVAMSETIHTLTVEAVDDGMRLDKFLAANLPELSRSRLQALIEQNCVTCNGKIIDDASRKVKQGHEYGVTIPEPVVSHMLPQAIDLDIVYEDKDLLIINKPAGLTVHPGAGNPDMTLVNALLAHCGDSLSGIGGVARPGIVHRIDKETSGLLVVAKHDAAHLALSAQLVDHSLKRTYAAILWGVPAPKSGKISGNIARSMSNRQKMTIVRNGGKPAITHYKTLRTFSCGMKSPPISHVECNLETGRTHQIRVHFSHLGHSLVGDPVYGQTTSSRLSAGQYKSLPSEVRGALLGFKRQALHARELGLIHPTTGKKMTFEAKLPGDMQTLIDVLSAA
jgi:23S rRNA pseudouridine1911/1915/1917 synthase